MIKLMLELVALFGEKKISKLLKFDDSLRLEVAYNGEQYSVDVTKLPEVQADDVQVQ